MNTMNQQLLSQIDEIESTVLESELNCCAALCNHYVKVMTFMEYGDPSYEGLTVFQESNLYVEADAATAPAPKEFPKTENESFITKIFKLIGNFLKKIADFISVNIKGIWNVVKNVFSHPEYRAANKYFAANKDQIAELYKNPENLKVPGKVPEVDDASESETKEEPAKVKDEVTPTTTEPADTPVKTDEPVKDTGEYKMYPSAIEAWKWFDAVKRTWDALEKIFSAASVDKLNYQSALKAAENAVSDKRYKNVHDKYQGSPTFILSRLTMEVETDNPRLKGKTKIQALDYLSNEARKFGDLMSKVDGKRLSKTIQDKSFKKDETALYDSLKDYVKKLQTSINDFYAYIVDLTKDLKTLCKEVEAQIAAENPK